MQINVGAIVDLAQRAAIVNGDRSEATARVISVVIRQASAKGLLDREEGRQLLEAAPAFIAICGWEAREFLHSLPMPFDEFSTRVAECEDDITAARNAVPETFHEFWVRSIQPRIEAVLSPR